MATAASLAAATEALATPPGTTPHATGPVASTSTAQPDHPQMAEPGPGPATPDPEDPDLPDDDIAWLNINELNEQEVDELQKCVDTCVERWKAAGPEARKKMFALFAVAGIFIAVCRHGHVLIMCDMIRSGELYALPYQYSSESNLTHLQYEISAGHHRLAPEDVWCRHGYRLRYHVCLFQDASPELLGQAGCRSPDAGCRAGIPRSCTQPRLSNRLASIARRRCGVGGL